MSTSLRTPGRKVQRAQMRKAGVFKERHARRRLIARLGGFKLKPGEQFPQIATVVNADKDRSLPSKARRRARRAEKAAA